MLTKIRKRMTGEGGFTLIELLVVIIIIAILAAIAIPTFLGQRQKAQEAAAKSLVRNGMTAMESAAVDATGRAFNSVAIPGDLTAIEPGITFAVAANEGAAANPAASTVGTVYVFSANAATYGMGSMAADNVTFGVRVNKSGAAIDGIAPGVTYYVANAVKAW